MAFELEMLVRFGVPPRRAGGRDPRGRRGLPGGRRHGTIAPGKRADLIAVAGDPLADIAPSAA